MKVEIGLTAHRYAKKFAAEQHDANKANQVFINTLVVCAVREYLKWLKISLDLHESSEAWDPILRYYLNSSSLLIPGLGSLVCVSYLPGEHTSKLPSEPMQKTIGYVGVQLSKNLDYANIIGFKETASDTLEVKDLGSIEDLILKLNLEVIPFSLSNWHLQNSQAYLDENWPPINNQNKLLNLNFKDNELEACSLDESTKLTTGSSQATAIERGKVFRLPNNSNSLFISILPRRTATDCINILFEVRTLDKNEPLPTGTQLIITDQDNKEIDKKKLKREKHKLNIKHNLTIGKSFLLSFLINEESIRVGFQV